MPILRSLFSTDFMPHAFCLRDTSLIALHAAADTVIALSYALIPCALLLLLRRRRDLAFPWMFGLFGVFILGCGLTHVLGVVTLWHPIYRFDALMKVITACASLLTALLLFRLLPAIEALPSPARLQVEVKQRQVAEFDLRESNALLERRVAERTAELETTNCELEEANRRLTESESRFRAMTDAAPNLLWSTDLEGSCIYVSSLYEKFTGLNASLLLGRQWEMVVHPDDRQSVLTVWHAAVRSGEAYRLEFRLRRFDGTYCWFVVRGVPMRDSDGKISRWMGSCTDIEELKRTESALRRSNDELRQFAYAAAHDLQEPLRNISNAMGVLKRFHDDKFDDAGAKWIGVSIEGAQRMHEMIQDLLSYSRALDDAENAPATADADEAARIALRNLQASLDEAGAQVSIEPLPTLRVHELHLVQVFQNLVGNAVKYRRREETLRIQISASETGDAWQLSVRDNGIGFHPQYADQIFGVFKRLHLRTDYPGNGIGLSICARIVSHYGGRIWAEGEPGKGAAFHFTLPAAQKG